MFRYFILSFFMLIFSAGFSCFGQAAAIRDYVGLISQTFHPGVVSYMEQIKANLEKKGNTAAVKGIDIYLKGETGTGFVYVANNGKNYILTNYHVISQAYALSVSFEKPDGERTIFSDLSIIAADEDMDIALLAFAGEQKPFTQGLTFLDRPVQEGDDVFSAGFPGLGTAMVWQFGRGMVSNASVRIPDGDDSGKMLGPFIQHTAQVDPGNSGGPLLARVEGVPAGYAVAGINTLSARFRQAANFSIPLSQVQSFLDASLNASSENNLSRLNTRVASFIEGLNERKAVFPHIAPYLSNSCIGENAEYALFELFEKAPLTTFNVIAELFSYSPVTGMSCAVAWTIENALRSKAGKISITAAPPIPADNGTYIVDFNANGKIIKSEWVNEYGKWRIRTFGNFAAGDQSLLDKKKKTIIDNERLAISPDIRISANFVYLIDSGPAFGAELKVHTSKYLAGGFQGYFGEDYKQIEFLFGLYIPIAAGKVAFTPFADSAFGTMFVPRIDTWGDMDPDFFFGASIKGGLMFTTAAVPGLYLQMAYQRNFYTDNANEPLYKNLILCGVGYAF